MRAFPCSLAHRPGAHSSLHAARRPQIACAPLALSPFVAAAVAALLVMAAPGAAQQEGRSLSWPEVRVDARLDADGRLHVTERHTLRFDGDWNGGERSFSPRLGQDLDVQRLARVGPSGELHPLTRDEDLDDVDEYHVEDGTVRWRSRLPSDPPFDDRRMSYVLEYTLSNAVLPVESREDGYLLDHDFLFSTRVGTIERARVSLALAPAWAVVTEPTGWEVTPAEDESLVSREEVDIPPGRGLALALPLRHAGPDAPATVPVAVPAWLRVALTVVLLGGTIVLAVGFLRRERQAGRFVPLPQVGDEAWLEEHVLRYTPELVGHAWDRSTSAPEVAGMLARLVQEGKLVSRVEPADEQRDEPVLHLELEADREAFDDGERPLIDALFFDGRTTTDTRTVKEHYKGKGFDPAGKIRPALDRRLEVVPGAGFISRGVGPAWVTVGVAAALLVAAIVVRPGDVLFAILATLGAAATAGPALGVAAAYARSVVHTRALAAGVILLLAPLPVALALVIAGAFETTDPGGALSPYYRPGWLLLVGLTLLGLATAAVVFRVARPSETPERLAFRRRLAAAREHFETELQKPDPALHDEWFPYLLAFGLGPRIDAWFESFGAPATAHHTATVASAAASGRAGGGWTGGGATFGGGGGFAGGGVGGSWSVAAATVASGVSSPSSGGTAGGSASSGGGGGGGW